METAFNRSIKSARATRSGRHQCPRPGPAGRDGGAKPGREGARGRRGRAAAGLHPHSPGTRPRHERGGGQSRGASRAGGPRPYHTSQCLPGFMGEPSGQPKCCTKSRELLRVPMTRYLSGLCGSVTSPSWELSGVRTEHHTWGRGTAVGTGETPPPWGARKWQPGGGRGAVLARSPRRRAGGW